MLQRFSSMYSRRGLTIVELIIMASVLAILSVVLSGPAIELFSSGKSQICLDNVHAFEMAKNSWCNDNFSVYSAIQQGATNLAPTTSAIAAYLPQGEMPTCPSGGSYLNITSIGVPVTCSIHGTNGLYALTYTPANATLIDGTWVPNSTNSVTLGNGDVVVNGVVISGPDAYWNPNYTYSNAITYLTPTNYVVGGGFSNSSWAPIDEIAAANGYISPSAAALLASIESITGYTLAQVAAVNGQPSITALYESMGAGDGANFLSAIGGSNNLVSWAITNGHLPAATAPTTVAQKTAIIDGILNGGLSSNTINTMLDGGFTGVQVQNGFPPIPTQTYDDTWEANVISALNTAGYHSAATVLTSEIELNQDYGLPW